MSQPEARQRRVAETMQVITGAKEDLATEAQRMMENHKNGKLLLEVFFEDGHAKSAKLHASYGCKK